MIGKINVTISYIKKNKGRFIMKKRYIIILLIINIILFIFLLTYKNKDENITLNGTTKEETTSIEFDSKIKPENFQKFEEMYSGKVDTEYIYGRIYNLVTKLYIVHNECQSNASEDLVAYYNNNKTKLNYDYSIKTQEDFISLINTLNKIYKNDNKAYYKTVKMDLDTYKDGEKNIECELIVVFNTSDELKLNMLINKNGGNKISSVTFKTITEE